jgi:hypothetical protein
VEEVGLVLEVGEQIVEMAMAGVDQMAAVTEQTQAEGATKITIIFQGEQTLEEGLQAITTRMLLQLEASTEAASTTQEMEQREDLGEEGVAQEEEILLAKAVAVDLAVVVAALEPISVEEIIPLALGVMEDSEEEEVLQVLPRSPQQDKEEAALSEEGQELLRTPLPWSS